MPVARPDSGRLELLPILILTASTCKRKRAELRGKPVAVVQFNPWKGGGLIAVSYEARKCGVTRNMRGDDAKKMCPDVELVQVPTAHGHAFLNPYRDAGSEVVAVLSRGGICERASIDEVYLDITEAAAARLLKTPPLTIESLTEEARRTHILGLPEDGEGAMTAAEWLCQSDSPRCDALLACGAIIVAELRTAVLAETQFTCSAGIAHNKMLAKLTSSMHKPAQQTVIPASHVPTLLASLPLKRIGQLGGKLGKSLQEELGVETPGDLLPYSELKLQELYGVNTGTWLWNIARGKNGDEVKGRVLPKSHRCGKTFAGPKALTDMNSVMHWLGEMCEELQERLDVDLEMHNRTARLLVFNAAVHMLVAAWRSQPTKKFPSKSCPLRYGKEKILADARNLFERGLRDFCPPNESLSPGKANGVNSCNWAVTVLAIGANGISAVPMGVNPITSFFTAPPRSDLEETNLPMSPPVSPPSCQITALAPEEVSGQCLSSTMGHSQLNEGSDVTSSPRTPATQSVEETTSVITKDNTLDDGSESLRRCSLVESSKCRNLFSADDDRISDVDIQCTPQFGSINSPSPRRSQFTLFEDGTSSQGFAPVEDTTTRIASSADSFKDLEPTLIQCSPVESSPAPSTSRREYKPWSLEFSCSQQVGLKVDGSSRPDIISDSHALERGAEQKVTRVVQPKLTFPSAKLSSETQNLPGVHGTCNSSGMTKSSSAASQLKILWQRNLATQAQSSLKRAPTNWEYNQDEIDEEVLSQLPADIQKELRDTLNLNRRQRPTKRPTINDFFPSSK